MSLRSLLYTSVSTLNPATATAEVKALVAQAEVRNRAHDVTGVLVFTGDRFAQVIEGTREKTETIFQIVKASKAHRDIVVLQDVEIAARQFKAWNMAYAGPSLFVANKIADPLAQALEGSTPDVRELLGLMLAFARAS